MTGPPPATAVRTGRLPREGSAPGGADRACTARLGSTPVWLFGRRVEPQWRPWVAERVTRPGYLLRRQGTVFAIQLVLVVIPQLLLSLADERPWRRIVFSAILGVAFAIGVLGARRKPEMQVVRLLAYYRVTADGRPREPVSAWRLMGYSSPISTPAVSGLLVAQFVMLASGAAIVLNHYTSPGRCQTAPAGSIGASRRGGSWSPVERYECRRGTSRPRTKQRAPSRPSPATATLSRPTVASREHDAASCKP